MNTSPARAVPFLYSSSFERPRATCITLFFPINNRHVPWRSSRMFFMKTLRAFPRPRTRTWLYWSKKLWIVSTSCCFLANPLRVTFVWSAAIAEYVMISSLWHAHQVKFPRIVKFIGRWEMKSKAREFNESFEFSEQSYIHRIHRTIHTFVSSYFGHSGFTKKVFF